jgi:hypothetical protein
MDLRLPEEYRYKPPADLTISNEDGRPITLRQFVTEVHAYLNLPDVMGDIKKMKAAFLGHPVTREDGSQGRNTIYGHPVKLPEEVQFFFTSTMIFERDGTVTFRLSLRALRSSGLAGRDGRGSMRWSVRPDSVRLRSRIPL